jgi:hypothetical protein
MTTKMYMSVTITGFHSREKSHEFKICNGKDLLLVCRDHHSSTDFVGGNLDYYPRQQYKRVGHAQDHIS